MILQIVLLVIFLALGIDIYFVFKQVIAAAKLFSKHSNDVFVLQMNTLAAAQEALQSVVAVHVAAVKEMVTLHKTTLQDLSATHAQAAVNLRGATDSHNVAASASADMAITLKQSGENLNKLLGDSNLFDIQTHLAALRHFWVK